MNRLTDDFGQLLEPLRHEPEDGQEEGWVGLDLKMLVIGAPIPSTNGMYQMSWEELMAALPFGHRLSAVCHMVLNGNGLLVSVSVPDKRTHRSLVEMVATGYVQIWTWTAHS